MERGTAKPRLHPGTIDGTPDGEPVMWTRSRIAEKRRDMGPYIFASQILQNPTADEAQNFKEEWLRYHDGVDVRKLVMYILVDAANGKRKRNDYTAMWAIGAGQDQNLYVVDMIRDRLNLTQRADRLMAWHRKYRPLQVRYEEYGMQGDIQHIRDRQAREVYRFEIIPVGGDTPKPDRIKRMIPYYEQGRVYLPRSLHATDYQGVTRDLVRDYIEEEYKPFPVGLHDDMADSLARIAEPDLSIAWPKEQRKPKADAAEQYGPSSGAWMG
jgi:predicted phage terminase large subunit-like protein